MLHAANKVRTVLHYLTMLKRSNHKNSLTCCRQSHLKFESISILIDTVRIHWLFYIIKTTSRGKQFQSMQPSTFNLHVIKKQQEQNNKTLIKTKLKSQKLL